MKSIALIHTVKSVASGFDDSLRNYLGYEVKIHNLWDDFLANNPNEIGEFTIQNRNRLFCDMRPGADRSRYHCHHLLHPDPGGGTDPAFYPGSRHCHRRCHGQKERSLRKAHHGHGHGREHGGAHCLKD